MILFLLLAGIASLWILVLLFVRFTYRVYRSREQYQRGKPLVPVAIIGAGVTGVQLLDELRMNPDSRYVVRCFFDNAPEKQRAYVHGVEVKGTIAEIPTRLEAMDIREVIVAMPSVSEHRRQEILEGAVCAAGSQGSSAAHDVGADFAEAHPPAGAENSD